MSLAFFFSYAEAESCIGENISITKDFSICLPSDWQVTKDSNSENDIFSFVDSGGTNVRLSIYNIKLEGQSKSSLTKIAKRLMEAKKEGASYFNLKINPISPPSDMGEIFSLILQGDVSLKTGPFLIYESYYIAINEKYIAQFYVGGKNKELKEYLDKIFSSIILVKQ